MLQLTPCTSYSSSLCYKLLHAQLTLGLGPSSFPKPSHIISPEQQILSTHGKAFPCLSSNLCFYSGSNNPWIQLIMEYYALACLIMLDFHIHPTSCYQHNTSCRLTFYFCSFVSYLKNESIHSSIVSRNKLFHFIPMMAAHKASYVAITRMKCIPLLCYHLPTEIGLFCKSLFFVSFIMSQTAKGRDVVTKMAWNTQLTSETLSSQV